jgi:LysR family glycine cleavage system transcriptional activator
MRKKIPSLQALACFDAAARHESYTRAAQELALSQSAVSRQIAALEQFLGLALFRRTRHGVALTASGAQYARQISPRLQALERDTLDAMSLQGSGSAIHLAAVPTFAARWLMPRLARLQRLRPELVVHLETQTRPFLFANTEFDAALYSGTPEQVANWAGTQALPLLREDVLPVCAPALLGNRKALSPQDISALPLLQQSTRPNAWRQWFEAQGVVAPLALSGPRYELFSLTAAAAACGMGVALVPTLLIEAELAHKELVVACNRPLAEARGYYLVTPQRADPNPALAAFSHWLQQVAREAQPGGMAGSG